MQNTARTSRAVRFSLPGDRADQLIARIDQPIS